MLEYGFASLKANGLFGKVVSYKLWNEIAICYFYNLTIPFILLSNQQIVRNQ